MFGRMMLKLASEWNILFPAECAWNKRIGLVVGKRCQRRAGPTTASLPPVFKLSLGLTRDLRDPSNSFNYRPSTGGGKDNSSSMDSPLTCQ